MKVEWTNRDNLSIETTSQNSKAILVIDIPEDYTGSVISVNLYGRNNKVIHEIHTNKLRPLPQKKAINTSDLLANAEAFGWNVCLDEITGETE